MCKKCDTDNSETTTATKPDISYSFYLGTVRDAEHDEQLQALAHWLDQNKFACTYSIVEGRAVFDTSPHEPEHWANIDLFSRNGFAFYAAEHIIYNLGRALGDKL